MKHLITFLLFSTFVFAQTPSVVQQDLNNFEPGELIVKLKDNVEAEISYSQNGKATSSFNVGALLGIENKVASSKVMFHQKAIEASIANSQKMKAVYAAKAAQNPNNGYTPKEPLTMKNIFVLKTNNEQENILQLIQQIQDNPNVEYAEPNYIYGIDDFEVGETITAEQAAKMESSLLIDVDDPLYPSQSNITATNIDDVWEQYTTGDGSQVIAILDTGVDYTHPDLEANIWINEAELNGVAGFDDDGNGYIDDIRGWDFINLDNAPLDDNMHGTHVAGIAGAVGNNGIGIAGAAWNVKLMPIKVFQASGSGSSITIAEGVEYASNNGATILNMSFASFGASFTLKIALENAYTTALLVAASGNNDSPIGPCIGCRPYYPAAYTFVIGVEDSVGDYSNYDQDGPLFSYYEGLLNYELAAPGYGIMSTIPNGGYSTLSGTSMATPLVAGSCALYNQIKNTDNKEILFGDFINSSNDNNFDLLAALNTEPTSIIRIISTAFDDDFDTNQYVDGFINAGETINIFSSVRNFWGTSGNIQMALEFGGNEFQNEYYASILNITDNTSTLPPLSNYAYNINTTDPFTIEINEGIPHNTEVEFIISAWDEDLPDQIDTYPLKINIKNIQKIVGPINNDITIYAGSYVIDELVLVNEATVTIKPGVTISFENWGRFKRLDNAIINAVGTRDSLIEFRRGGLLNNGIVLEVDNCSWCDIKGQTVPNGAYADFNLSANDAINNSYMYTKFSLGEFSSVRGNVSYSNFDNVLGYGGRIIGQEETSYQYNNLIGYNHEYGITTDCNLLWNRPGGLGTPLNTTYILNGVIYAPVGQDNNIDIVDNIFVPLFGNPELLSDWIMWDLSDATGNSFPNSDTNILSTENMRTEPYEETPPFLWNLELNNKIAYYSPDPYFRVTTSSFKVPQYDPNIFQTDPIGVGTHEIKLYFNHAMDTTVLPVISYGVIEPYNQKIISETGTWNAEGTEYTVNHEINIGAADGINRIRVSGAKDLIYDWEIPTNQNHHFTLQSAGSASTGFFAAGGLGKIDLEWLAPSADDIDDVLGYNMYRYQIDADGVESEPEKLNETLIIEDTDESTTGVYFSDYDVFEGETYFYKYKILRTSFEETDYSNTVSSSPLTSTLGDSNGDFDVNVLDLVHDVDYILGNNPEPFIFVAGDVNADNTINVLDIVGTVDIIFNGDGGDTGSGSLDPNFYPSQAIGFADFSWEGNDLYVESMHNIGGLQLAFDADFEYVLHELPGIERLDYTQDQLKVLMLYSFNNTTIASTRTKLLTRVDATQDININLAVAGTTTGAKLTPRFKDIELAGIASPFQSSELEFLNLFPNPTSGEVTLMYYMPEQMDGAVAKVYDMLGRLVWAQAIDKKQGMQQANINLNTLQKGNYIVLISAHKNGGTKNIANKTLIIK